MVQTSLLMQFLTPLGICIHSARVPIPYGFSRHKSRVFLFESLSYLSGQVLMQVGRWWKFTYNQIHDYSRIRFVEPKLSKRVFMVLVKKQNMHIEHRNLPVSQEMGEDSALVTNEQPRVTDEYGRMRKSPYLCKRNSTRTRTIQIINI